MNKETSIPLYEKVCCRIGSKVSAFMDPMYDGVFDTVSRIHYREISINVYRALYNITVTQVSRQYVYFRTL